jgi:hypothetical protein
MEYLRVQGGHNVPQENPGQFARAVLRLIRQRF